MYNKNKKDFNLFIFFSIYYLFIILFIYSGRPGASNSGQRPLEIRLRQPSPRLYDMLYDRSKLGGRQSSSSSSSSLMSSIPLAAVLVLVSGAGAGAAALASLSPR